MLLKMRSTTLFLNAPLDIPMTLGGKKTGHDVGIAWSKGERSLSRVAQNRARV